MNLRTGLLSTLNVICKVLKFTPIFFLLILLIPPLKYKIQILASSRFAVPFNLWIIAILFLSGLCWWVRIEMYWRWRVKADLTELFHADDQSQKIIDAYGDWNREAEKQRDYRNLLSLLAAYLGPFAVAFLACQMIFYPNEGSSDAEILIGIEIFLIICSIAVTYRNWPIGKTHQSWVPARLRAELLRRELFLYYARVGPYLTSDEKQLEQMIVQRLQDIGLYSKHWMQEDIRRVKEFREQRGEQNEEEGSEAEQFTSGLREMLNRLISLEDYHVINDTDNNLKFTLTHWTDQLEEAQLDIREERSDFIDSYLHDRLRNQRDGYFSPKSGKHHLLDEAYETMAALTLGFAGVLACMHLLLLMAGENSREVSRYVEFLALVLPPIGAGFVALRSSFENHRLIHSYNEQVYQLTKLEREFRRLDYALKQLDSEAVDYSILKTTYIRRLKRAVLRTETLISHELRRWWMIVWPERPKPS